MKKIFFVLPRQSRKSEAALTQFLKSPDDSLLVSTHRGGYDTNIVSPNISEQRLRGKNFRVIILDDYLSYPDPIKTYQTFSTYISYARFPVEELYIYSTPVMVYPISVINMVKLLKRQGLGINYIEDKMIYSNPYGEHVLPLYYNFLTDLDVKILQKKWDPRDLVGVTDRVLCEHFGVYFR
jgi:hypothetical protein